MYTSEIYNETMISLGYLPRYGIYHLQNIPHTHPKRRDVSLLVDGVRFTYVSRRASNRMVFYLIRCRCLLLRRTAGAVYSRLIGRCRHDALMIQMAQLIQLRDLLRLLHRILGVGLQLLMMRLMRGVSRLMMRRGVSG